MVGGQALKGVEADMLVNALTRGLSRFTKGRREHMLQNGDKQGLHCVDETVSGLKVVALVEIGVTHSFMSEQTTWGLHRMVECNGSSFKVVNSGVNPVDGIVRSTPLTVGSWLGVLDMKVVPLDIQSVILG